MIRKLILFGILISAAAVSLFGQAAGFGAISGTVRDATGGAIANAKVVVSNEAKGIHRELASNNAGVFMAPGLVPSDGYSVKAEASGFAPYEAKEIQLLVGQTIDFPITLTVAASTTTVTVTEAGPAVDSTKTDVSQVIDSKQIQDLPINGRRVDNFVLLTPGVTTDGPFGLISFRGNPGGNTFLTDGNDTTNQFYNENAGRTRTTNISQDAVQEFQVVSSNFLAEYGRASGGVINTVTRSGGNDIHGTAYWFFRNRTLNATDITARGVNPPEWRHQAGASIGGPIKKDKLFYFFNGEVQRRNAPIVSSNVTSSIFDSAGNIKPGTCVTSGTGLKATPDQCQAAINYIQSRTNLQLIPRTMDTNLLFGKIDYRPTDKDALSFSANYVDFRSPNGIQTQLSLADGFGIGGNADTNVFDRTARASWTRVLTSSAVSEARFGYFKDRQYDPASPSLLPSIGPVALTVQGVSNVAYANGYPRLNPSEQRVQAAESVSWVKGTHSMKFGFDYAHVEDYVSRLANRYGTYTYATLTAFALDFSGNATGARNYQSYSQAFGNPVVDTNLNEFAVFAQDQWKVSSKITINYGLRWEYTTIPQPPLSNPAYPQTARIPGPAPSVAPRVGVAYAINPKTTFRAGYGIYYNRYNSSTIENLFLTNNVYQGSVSFATPTQIAAGGPVFPNALPTQTFVPGTAGIIYAANSWRNPYSEQMTAAIEREILKNTTLTVSYVWSRGLHLIQTRDNNVATPTSTYTFPVLDTSGNVAFNYTTPIYTTRLNPAYGFIGQFDSAGNTYYNGLLVQATRRFANWLQGSIAYTWSHNIDYNQGGGGNTLFGSSFPTSVFNGDYTGEKGNSSIDQRHRFVLNAVVAPTFTKNNTAVDRYLINNWQLSVVSIAASSQYLTATIRVQDRVPGTLSTSSLNGLGGSNRVPFIAPSSLPLGPLYRTDARIAKMLPFGERFKLYLQFEAFNVFNHVYVNGPSPKVNQQYTSIRQTSGPLAGIIALVPYTPYGTILQTQTPPDGTTARRAQVGLRFVF
jgi:hypothetical protein